MNTSSLPVISLPSPHNPSWVTPYNCSAYYHLAYDEEPLRVKLLQAASYSSGPTSRGLDQIRGVLRPQWYEVQDHPHIAPASFAAVAGLLDPRTNAPTVALISPYYEQHDFLESCKNATVTEKITWLAQLCEAVQHLHDNRVFHGNIHCRNVVITNDKLARLTDVGLYYLVRNLRDLPQLPQTIACKTARAVQLLSTDEEIPPPSMEDDNFALAATIFTVYKGAEPWRKAKAVKEIAEYGHRRLAQPEGMSDGLWRLLHGIFCQDGRPIPNAREIKQELLFSLVNPAERHGTQGLFPRMLRALRGRSPSPT